LGARHPGAHVTMPNVIRSAPAAGTARPSADAGLNQIAATTTSAAAATTTSAARLRIHVRAERVNLWLLGVANVPQTEQVLEAA
jgi:hypothetical protein